MKKTGKAVFTAFLGLALVTGFTFQAYAASETEQKVEGFLGDLYKDLTPGPEGGAKMRWIKPATDFSKYNKVMIDSVVFFLAEDSKANGLDPQELADLASGFNLQLVNALKDKYPVVSDPGPDVLRLRFAITDMKPSKPGISGISSVVPIGLGVSLFKKGATGGWTGSGATTGEMMALDSVTGDVIAAGQDERTAAFGDRFSKWGSAEEAFKFWGERIRLFMDSTRSPK